jgi:S1-C subfamily serine protease
MSVTQGIVSRVDFRTYSHSVVDQHLSIQIDAAINPGNSGGPVMQGHKVVGVAFRATAAMSRKRRLQSRRR